MTKNRALRYTYFGLRVLFFPLVPVAIITIQYDLVYFREYTATKLTLAGTVIVAAVVIIFWKHLKGWISTWHPSLGKSFVDIFISLLPVIIMSGLLEGFRRNIGDLYVVWWMIVGSYIISILFKQGHDYYLINDVERSKIKKYS